MNRILVDGIDYTGQVEGVDDLAVTFQQDTDTKTISVSISNELIFRQDAFRYLETKFFSSTSGGDKDASIRIIETCCNHEYDFFIRGDAVDYCPAICEIVGAVTERKPELSSLSNIPETLGPVTVPYCINVSVIQATLFVIFEFLEIVVNVIDRLLSVIPGLGLGNLPNALAEIQESLIGCNRDKAGYNLREYFEQCASEAGLTFQSSIFSTPPYEDTHYIDTNNSIGQLSCIEMFELVKVPFNADYLIKGGVLYFERVDFFNSILTRFVNVDQIYDEGRSDSAPCYQYTGEAKPAYGRYEYSRDNIDDEANDILTLTNDIVDFNNPLDPYKSGSLTITIPFSPARYTNDAESNASIDALRPPNRLIMTTTQSQYPKLVIGQKVGNNLTPQSRPRPGTGREDFTYQMWFDANDSETELYQNFWFISDPRESSFLPYVLDEFTFQATCDEFDVIKREGIDVIIETKLGDARPNSIRLNYSNMTITLSGVQII